MGKYGSVEKVISMGLESWQQAAANGLARIRTVSQRGNRLVAEDGHEFINMVSCSYLGLNRHPKVLEGAVAAITREGTMSISVSRARIAPKLLDEVEELMTEVFRCQALVSISCTAASAGILPILASGHMTAGSKPYMVFDKHSHFSMNVMKAACGNETEVVTCEHNDLDFLEDACRRHATVAYVGDGAYSMGGSALVPELRRLQDEYGLFLYLDDSHSISVNGKRGEGLVRSQLEEVGERTVIVGSLAKAFGGTGGVILLGSRSHRQLVDYFGGPLSWSQMVNPAGLGAIGAAARIHLSDELGVLQRRLKDNMDRFDAAFPTANSGNGLPIRVIDLPSVSAALEASVQVYRRGFYTSAVFFPIVARGRAGLRVMNRADMTAAELDALCTALREVTSSGLTANLEGAA